MFHKIPSKLTSLLVTTLLAVSILLAACSPAVPVTPPPAPAPTSTPRPTSAPAATASPTAAAAPTTENSLHITLDTGSLASGWLTETVPAVTDTANNPYWLVLPAYTRLTLQGYPLANHPIQPQIFIYPVEELKKANAEAGKNVTALQTLLHSPQEMKTMPFLPLQNAAQVMHTHLQYLEPKNGKGLRYLTQFNQGIVPINNTGLVYTYQGLTGDGKYVVSAVLPVTHPSLPADGKLTGKEPPEFMSDHSAYLANVAQSLNTQPPNTFSPDLTQLDAMLSSLEIK